MEQWKEEMLQAWENGELEFYSDSRGCWIAWPSVPDAKPKFSCGQGYYRRKPQAPAPQPKAEDPSVTALRESLAAQTANKRMFENDKMREVWDHYHKQKKAEWAARGKTVSEPEPAAWVFTQWPNRADRLP